MFFAGTTQMQIMSCRSSHWGVLQGSNSYIRSKLRVPEVSNNPSHPAESNSSPVRLTFPKCTSSNTTWSGWLIFQKRVMKAATVTTNSANLWPSCLGGLLLRMGIWRAFAFAMGSSSEPELPPRDEDAELFWGTRWRTPGGGESGIVP